jgi:hypothetical protein
VLPPNFEASRSHILAHGRPPCSKEVVRSARRDEEQHSTQPHRESLESAHAVYCSAPVPSDHGRFVASPISKVAADPHRIMLVTTLKVCECMTTFTEAKCGETHDILLWYTVTLLSLGFGGKSRDSRPAQSYLDHFKNRFSQVRSASHILLIIILN